MQFRVLGPLEVVDEHGLIALGPPKQRRLLAVLISRVNELVSVDVLIEGVWEGAPPRSAAKTIQGYVVHLRQALSRTSGDASAIVTVPGGYRLEITSDALDSTRFTALVGRGRHAVALRDWPSARVFLQEGLSLWRGSAYAEFAGSAFATAEAARLEELRWVAQEAAFEVDLHLGEDAALVPELEKALAEEPTRESLWELLIRAQYRGGQQSEALATYARAREILADELGIEPGPALRGVHAAVLSQDPSLDRPGAGNRIGGSAWQPAAGVYAFDGREDDLGWLRSQWLATVEGGGRIAVLAGDSGIGKTRLLAAFASEIERSESVVIRRTGMAAPSLAAIAGVAGSRPVLIALDDPLTGFDVHTLAERHVLIVVALNPARAPTHVVSSLATAAWWHLAPLSAEVCARIAHRWVTSAGVEIDTPILITSADGNPGRLHRSLAQAVEQVSGRDIDESVNELRAARADLDIVRAELTRGVRSRRRGRALYASMPGVAGAARAGCPYRGLDTYGPEDAPLLHGRDAVIEQLVARLADTPLVAVVGASGTGKSSIVRAGLLPALADGCLPGSGTWPQFVTTPDQQLPTPSEPAVVVVDQLEQAWVVRDDDDRSGYLDAILSLIDAGHRVVLTLRTDHVERCSRHQRLREVLSEATVLVGTLSPGELAEVITGPAEMAGYVVEDGLVDVIVDDVRALPAPLPLLSTALAETWKAAVGGTLSMDAYFATGGVSGSLARRAEVVLAAMEPKEQAAARKVLLRLATGENGVVVRRRCPYQEAASDEAARRAVEALSAARLITIDADAVEVTHEALFDNWPRLAGWLQEDAQGRRLRDHLAPAARAWADGSRPESDLYGGVRLDAALAWSGDHDDDLTPTERDFLTASRDRSARELQAERDRATREADGRRRLRILLVAVGTAAAVAIAATVLALAQRGAAKQEALLATARRLGAAALVNQPLDQSLLLAVSAVRMRNNVDTRSDLLTALQRAPAAQSVWPAPAQDPLYQLVLTQHDHVAVAAGLNGITTWDLTSRDHTAADQLQFSGYVPVLAARPRSTQVAMTDVNPASGGWQPIELRDWAHGTETELAGATHRVTSMSWSPDGRWLAAAQTIGDVLVWDLHHLAAAPRQIRRLHPIGPVNDLGFPLRFPAVSYAGRNRYLIVERSGHAQLSALGAARPLRTFFLGRHVSAVATVPAGKQLAVGHDNGMVSLSSLATGRSLPPLTGHSAPVADITFSSDGRLVATVGDDNAVNVSNLQAHRLIGRFTTGHTEPVTGAAFTADDRTLYTSSEDSSVIGWDLVNLNNLGARLRAPDTAPAAGLNWVEASPSGDIGAEFSDGTLRLWRRNRTVPTPPIRIRRSQVRGATFSPNGRLLAMSVDPASVTDPAKIHIDELRLLNVRSARVRTESARIPAAFGGALAFSPNGRFLAAAGDPNRLEIIDLASLRPVETLRVVAHPRQVAWSPDSHKIAVGSWLGGGFAVYDLATRTELWSQAEWYGLAWSPDGKTLASGDREGGITLWRAADGTPAGGGWHDHTLVSQLAYSPDGSILASTGFEGAVVLRDVNTGEQIGPPMIASYNQQTLASFDGRRQLAVFTADGGIWRWNIDLRSMLTTACRIAGRNLTTQEWAALHTGRPHVAACS